MKPDTLYFGGSSMHKCTWSAQNAPAVIFTFLYPQSMAIIS